MIQSTFDEDAPSHTAIIMDGNGRWATRRGLPRAEGHRAGTEAVRRVAEAASSLGIRTLTLYAFSSDNWKRPPAEVRGLFALLEHFLRRESRRCAEEGIEVRLVGRRDRLPWSVAAAIREAESRTRGSNRLTLRIAVDYSSRDTLVQAAARCRRQPTRESFAESLAGVHGEQGRGLPEVDLLIRTSGEQRLSDFLLWECAYAELYFTPELWPDFGEDSLRGAVDEFRRRRRRYGGLSPEPSVDSVFPMLSAPVGANGMTGGIA